MSNVGSVSVADLWPLIDKKWLFTGLWKLQGRHDEGERVLARFEEKRDFLGFAPKYIEQVYLSCFEGNQLSLLSDDGETQATFAIKENLLSAMIQKLTWKGEVAWDLKKVAISCVTVGSHVKREIDRLHAAGEYQEFFYLTGLAQGLAEVLTEYVHRKVCRREEVLHNETIRISPGYPVWPDLSDQRKIADLLKIDQIGVSVSETHQLTPEFSTTSMIL